MMYLISALITRVRRKWERDGEELIVIRYEKAFDSVSKERL